LTPILTSSRGFIRGAAALLALAFCAWAGPAAGDGVRFLSDPSFLPSQGQVLGTSTFTHLETDLSEENDQLLVIYTKQFSSNETLQALSYGLTDDLTVRVSGSYLWQREQLMPAPNGPVVTTDSQGPEEPALGATWRVLDQAQRPINADLILSYEPDLFGAEASSVSRTGTVARGSQALTVGGALSWVTRYITVYAELEGSYVGPRRLVNADDTVEAYNGYYLGTVSLNSQFRFSGLVSMNAGMTGDWNNGYGASNQNTGASFEDGGDNEIDYNVALNLQILPNTVAASLIYTNATYSFGPNVYPLNPSQDTITAYDNVQTFGLRVEYLFL
jgi:hypothetical protein